jgi:polysaccharide deacetylase 2 family uncharacterized protein YibQ
LQQILPSLHKLSPHLLDARLHYESRQRRDVRATDKQVMRMNRRTVVGGIVLTAAGANIGRAGISELSNRLATPAADVPMPAEALSAAPGAALTAAPAPVIAPPPSVAATVAPAGLPRWQKLAVKPPKANGRPIITLVIDDMGVMHPGTDRIIALPGLLTLSWFPFAPRLTEQAAIGAAHGHETMLHMPMQSFSSSTVQTGPDPLRIDLPAEVNLSRLRTAIDSIPSAVGLNNHMGSVATRDVPLMDLVAKETRSRDMLFLDSLTISHSVALQQARLNNVPSVARDVFVDNSASPALIDESLALIEKEARTRGRVVAIGHPRAHTLTALEAWVPTLADRGFVLWPLSAMVALENGIEMPA